MRRRSPEVEEDDDVDVFAVKWQGDRCRVRHYPRRSATTPCCTDVDRITDEDRRQASADGIDPKILTLGRVDRLVNQRHGQGIGLKAAS